MCSVCVLFRSSRAGVSVCVGGGGAFFSLFLSIIFLKFLWRFTLLGCWNFFGDSFWSGRNVCKCVFICRGFYIYMCVCVDVEACKYYGVFSCGYGFFIQEKLLVLAFSPY